MIEEALLFYDFEEANTVHLYEERRIRWITEP